MVIAKKTFKRVLCRVIENGSLYFKINKNIRRALVNLLM